MMATSKHDRIVGQSDSLVDAGSAGSARPLRADARLNAERVLRGARQAIANSGLDVGYHEIARQANVGVGTVYRRFPDRAQLLEAVLLDILDDLSSQAEQALEGPDAWAGFTAFFDVLVQRFGENAGLSESLADKGGEKVANARLQLIGLIKQVTERAQREGVLRRDIAWQDVPLLAASLPIPGYCILDLEASPTQLARCATVIIDGLKVRDTALIAPPADGSNQDSPQP